MSAFETSIQLLQSLIAIPSFSKEEGVTADILYAYLKNHGVDAQRDKHNVWAKNLYFDASKPSILLNSHHDTVKPNQGYTRNPFEASIEGDKLYGLGSNDAGAALVSLIASFLHFYGQENLPFNLILAATAEEEISGANGIADAWQHFPKIDMAIVGEPTSLKVAIAEKGLLVLDCVSKGKAAHAARDEGRNAIYEAMGDIHWFRTHQFEKLSETLGEVKMTVTQIQAGTQHNVVPDTCAFVVDARVTDAYTLEEVLDEIKSAVRCEVKPRSMRLRPSGIEVNHPLVMAAKAIGLELFGSATLSDQALIPLPSIKLGPGDSARSHTEDEFVYLHEIEKGIETYIALLKNIKLEYSL
ncbi:MAG TPA: M20 family metallo-hydrolase [Cyclobacteriaceae bacterium]|nr:M20 family metallo-hydrolase [Cyclobacteriaceae bacterium]